jgi:hypothetical protein
MKTMKAIMVFMLLITSTAGAAVNNLIFRLEVELKVRPNIDDFEQFQPSEGNLDKGEKVLAGKYEEYLLAMKAKYGFAKISSNPAVIVAFFNNEKVTLDEAFAIINNENVTDEAVINRPDTATTTQMIENMRSEIKFKFEFYADQEHTLNMLLEKHPEWAGTVVAMENNKFLVGSFTNHDEALAMQNQLDKEGFKRNILVAYQHAKKVPVLVARGFNPKPTMPVMAHGK